MSKENSKDSAKDGSENSKGALTKAGLKAFLAEIEQKVIASNGSYFHSVLALNEIMRLPNIEKLLDADTKNQMSDLWVKLKASGIQLNDPPLLFGLPENFASEHETEIEDEDVDEILEAAPVKPAAKPKAAAKITPEAEHLS